MADHQIFELGEVTLQSGAPLPSARLAYQTHGELNAAKSNAVLLSTWFTGQHRDAAAWIIGTGRALDPQKHFVIVVNILGNGLSSSPSIQPPPFDGLRFPRISLLDNARLQRRLIREQFGIERLSLVLGRSMGAQIAFQWGSYYPDEVRSLLAIEGSARTSPHNYAYLATMKMALESDPAWQSGEYRVRPTLGVERMRLIADSWGFSQDWYRQGLYKKMGFATTDAFLHRALPQPAGDTNDFLAQIATWESADISNNDKFASDLSAALAAIRAKAIVMPSRTDLYFPPEDNEIEVRMMPNAELRIVPTVWGHRAGSPGTDPADTAFIESAIRDLLDDG